MLWWLAAWQIRKIWSRSTPAERAAMLYDLGQLMMDQTGNPGVDPMVAHAYRVYGDDLRATAQLIVDPLPLPAPPARISAQSPRRAAILTTLLLYWMGSLAANPDASRALKEQLQRAYVDGEAMADAAEPYPDPLHVRGTTATC